MKKKKTGLIVMIVVLAILVVILAVLAVLYFTTDVFKTGQQAFFQTVSKSSETFNTLVSDNYKIQAELKNNYSYNTNGTITTTTNTSGTIATSNYVTTARKDNTTGRFYADIAWQNAGEELLKYSYINDADLYAFKCDDVLANYIGIRNSNLKEYIQNMGVDETQLTNIPDNVDFEAVKSAFNFTEEEKAQLKEKYLNVITTNISEEKFKKDGKESITVNNVTYNANKYSVTLTSEEVKEILTNLINTAKEDDVLINAMAKLQNALTGNVDTKEITDKLENIVTSLQNSQVARDSTFSMSVYSYGGTPLRIVAEVSENGKLTVDLDKKTQNVKLLVEEYGINGTTSTISQITFNKSNSNSSVLYNIEIIPNTLNINETTNISIELGNVTENGYTNTFEITTTQDENTTTNIQATTTTTTVDQVDEIEELTDANAIILNNYSIDQVTQFLLSYIQKSNEVIQSKIQIAGNESSLLNVLTGLSGFSGLSTDNDQANNSSNFEE